MSNIKYIFFGLLGGTTLLWLLSDAYFSNVSSDFMAIRATAVNYSGLMGITLMSVSMILALRLRWIENIVGGLDKSYRLHKWLGIGGLVMSIVHWLWAQGPKWAVQLGLLERGPRVRSTEEFGAFQAFLRSQRGLAESVAEWAFYGAVALMVLALVKYFPYKYFLKTHRILAITYLVLVFHSFILINFMYWGKPVAFVMFTLMAGGTIGAFYSLFRKIGHNRKTEAVIDGITHFEEEAILKVSINLKDNWAGHKAGQFAFLTFDQSEGPHPFTISSAWKEDGKMFFLIKALGDYTRHLPEVLKVGDSVMIEGPYGKFDFKAGETHQIWVAGGIGVTPFISRLQDLQSRPTHQNIDFFYSSMTSNNEIIEKLKEDSQKAGVNLHIINSDRDGFLNAAKISACVPNWAQSCVWFCGPSGFGESLKQDFQKMGLSRQSFHQELFEMR